MSLSKKSSDFSIRTLKFPEEYADFKFTTNKSQCPIREFSLKKPKVMRSIDMGIPEVLTIKDPKDIPSTIISTTPRASCSKKISRKLTSISTSMNLADTPSRNSVKPTHLEFQLPCEDSIILGAPQTNIGKCPANNRDTRGMRKKHPFKLTEDPRKRFCLKNPEVLHFKQIPLHLELANIREFVKNAENVVTSSDSQSTASSICEVIDLSNPLNLDFQGIDYENTYGQDEQTTQNQREYRKVRRYKHRRNVKRQTVIDTEMEQQAERIAVPNHFIVDNSPPTPIPVEATMREKSNVFGKLVRSEQKPEVIDQLDAEEKKRRERYKQLYIRKKEKLAKQEEEKKAQEEATTKNKAKMLAEKDIQDLVGLLDRTITTKKRELRKIPERRDFPHTTSETLKFRQQLKESKRIIRDRAKVKLEFYTERKKHKLIPETQLEISSDSGLLSSRDEEQSTNDEDDLTVGQHGSKFLLRGFQYKMGSNLRGKFHQKDRTDGERNIKGCMTREEWFETLVSQKNRIEDNQKPVVGMDLFPPVFGVKKPIVESPIKEFRSKPLGRHYDRVIRKNLRIRKPKQVKVMKFDLIGYVYGIGGRKKLAESMTSIHEGTRPIDTMEYINNKAKIAKLMKRRQSRRRMHFLGIPCPNRKQEKSGKSLCVDSESGDSDWIPNDASEVELSNEQLDLRTRGNMPAPEYREPTLRRHPRHPRDYRALRVPSEEFDDFVENHNIPTMKKLECDKNILENVRAVKNTEYGRKFEARHHHDHWDPTQHKTVHIRYSRKIIRPKPMKEKSEQSEKHSLKTFDTAQPRGEIDNVEEINIPILELNIDELIKEYVNKSELDVKSRLQEPLRPQTKNIVFPTNKLL